MKEFTAEVQENIDTICLKLSGKIGIETKLPAISNNAKTLFVQMAEVKYINSYGLSVWKKWMDEKVSVKKIILDSVPVVFIKQLQTFHNLISSNTEIKSFYVPFYSDELEEQKEVLLKEGIDYQQGKFVIVPRVTDSNNNPMELDCDTEKIFSFLNAIVKVE